MKCHGYWGKTDREQGYHLLPYHMLDVAACAQQLIVRSDRLRRSILRHLEITGAELARLIAWAAVLHDLGKLSPSFQRQDEVTSALADRLGVAKDLYPYDPDHRHDKLGWALWFDVIAPRRTPLGKENVYILMQCATGHHGKPPSRTAHGTMIVTKNYFTSQDIEAAREILDWATARFAPVFPDSAGIKKASWWIAGVITLADWLGSNKEFFRYEQGEIDLDAYYDRALTNADRAIEETGVVMPGSKREFHDLFAGYTPTSVQQAVLDLPTGDSPFFLAIEETTGGGKTEAALAAARGSSLFFGLPTMATANGLWNRIKLLEGQQVLIHGKSWLMPDAMDRATAWLADNNRKALLADIGVGTIDQAMIGVMYAKYGVLRLAGLAGKTLIIDEVHAYDAYMKGIIETLITMQARSGGSVILLSATLPLSHRRDYAAAWCNGMGIVSPELKKTGYPLVTFIDHQGGLVENDKLASRYQSGAASGRTIRVEYAHSASVVIDRLMQEAGSGKCAVWIRNTVGEAIEAYEAVKARGGDAILFHSRFLSKDRARIEADVLSRFGKTSGGPQREGKILIATQVVEQSLDLDFDFMATDLCPADLLVQRAGRLHRHDRGTRGIPVLLVHAPVWSDAPDPDWIQGWSRGAAFVYPDHAALWNTYRLVGNGFTLPGDARRLIEGVFANAQVPPGLGKRSLEQEGRALIQASAGNQAAIRPDAGYRSEGGPTWSDECSPTRLGDAMIEWIVCEDNKPFTGDAATSTISLRASKVKEAPVAVIQEASWQKTMNLTHGRAVCTGSRGEVVVTYDGEYGLRY